MPERDALEHYFPFTFQYFVKVLRVLIWISTVTLCTYFMFKQLADCLNKLSNPPIVTQTQIKNFDYMSYPAVTFCYKNTKGQGYDDIILMEQFNFSSPYYWIDFSSGTYENYPWHTFPFGNISVAEVWELSTYNFVDLTHFGGKYATAFESESEIGPRTKSRVLVFMESLNQIPARYQGVLVSSRFFHDHGQCYTVKPPAEGDKPVPGEQHGYQMYFLLIQGKPNRTQLIAPGGFDIFIHDEDHWWSENPLMNRGETLHVETGHMAGIQIQNTRYNTLSRPDAECNENRSRDDLSYSECIEKCRWRKITSDIPCLTPFMDTGESLPMCENEDDFLESMDRYRQWTDRWTRESCVKECKPDCKIKIYRAQLVKKVPLLVDSDTEVPEHHCHLHIYYDSGFSEELNETWGYDMTLFIGDFGGSLGFLLGISILSIIEIIEGLCIFLYNVYRERNYKRLLEKRAAEKAVEDDILNYKFWLLNAMLYVHWRDGS